MSVKVFSFLTNLSLVGFIKIVVIIYLGLDMYGMRAVVNICPHY